MENQSNEITINLALLKKYNLVFQFTDKFGALLPQAYGSAVADFPDDVDSSRAANDYLLKTALYLKGGIAEDGENSLLSNTYGASICDGQVSVFLNHPGYPGNLAVLPLKDFHEILEMWRDFLIENGW